MKPFKKEIQGIVVESTYNWYWLVDGLQEAKYKVHLANPAEMQQYSGMKYTDDTWDSYWLAHMLRLGILPEGYIYPKEISKQLSDEHHIMAVQSDKAVIDFFHEQIDRIEKVVLKEVKLRYPYKELITVPGRGEILGITIMLETGDINRFPTVSFYSSYCRCVSSQKISNGKKKGEGNKYLAWAYVEAANFMRRYSEPARSWHQRKASKTNKIVAIKALSNKIARACYFIIKDQKPFDPKKLFQ